jgi:hypothetical protein
MIEIFRTNVTPPELAEQLTSALRERFPFAKINFDLDDCDKVLRIEGHQICAKTIVELVTARGFECEVLL